MSKRAPEKLLGELHALLAKEFKDRLVNGEEYEEDGEKKTKKVSASTLNVIRQFLKDNSIDAVATESNPLGDLINSLPTDFGVAEDYH